MRGTDWRITLDPRDAERPVSDEREAVPVYSGGQVRTAGYPGIEYDSLTSPGGGTFRMNKQEFDAYRQGFWNHAAAIVDEHDRFRNEGTLTASVLNGQILALSDLLAAFAAQADLSRSPKGPIPGSWLDSRFHDFYDFFEKVLEGWRRDAAEPGIDPVSGEVMGGGTVLQEPRAYRLWIETVHEDGVKVYDTGATLPGCSEVNTGPCDPQEFGSLQDVFAYAASRNEVPRQVHSVAEAWAIVASGEQAPPLPALLGNLGDVLASVPPLVWFGLGASLLLAHRRK